MNIIIMVIIIITIITTIAIIIIQVVGSSKGSAEIFTGKICLL